MHDSNVPNRFRHSPSSKFRPQQSRPLNYYANLLDVLRYGSCTSSGYREVPAKVEAPMPPRLYRRRRSSANADFRR